eukprot:TRINITY_DN607_c0_g1_i2.p1 TRINITY_DN607_c0_g1~~TRINITY_DN607_c0_g1_i2.p1  ORF type:complete len:271 (-),score=30.37 TRINITY_DN607_c0_g1_i2:105-869(-)
MAKMMQRAAVAFSVTAGIASAVWDSCPRGPVGSCHMMSCSALDGPTVCESGQCNCIPGYCRYPNFRIHLQPRRCRAQVPDSSCHATRFCYKGGVASSSCVSGRCLCRTGMHVGADGQCHSGWYPDNNDKPCLAETGGTCRFLGCDSSRAAQCISGKCVCAPGKCSENGVCTQRTLAFAAMNTTGLPAYTADAETIAQEDFEIAVNLATGAAIVAFPLAFLGVVGVMVRRRLRQRGTITEERLLEGDEYGQLDGK